MYTAKRITSNHTGRRTHHGNLYPAAILPLGVLYLELLVRAFNRDIQFFSMALLRILLFSSAAGLLFYLILDLLPWK